MSSNASASASSSASSKPTVVITGASRGIGLGLVEVYAAKGWRVIATARDPAKADKLQALVKANGAVVVALDVSDSKSVAALPKALADAKVSSIDLLINNAGISRRTGSAHDAPTSDEGSALHTDSVANFADVFRTNVIGVWEVSQALLPLVRASTVAGGPKVAHISSTMGSIEGTLSPTFTPWAGRLPAYRVSKAALNELGAVQSREWNEATVKALASTDAAAKAAAAPLITVVQVHPGWVDTDMGNGAGKPPTSVAQSTTGIEAALSAVKPTAKAIFLDFENKPLPW